MKILFVCTGNTCRSPMAEAIANFKIKIIGFEKSVKFESAGLVGPAGLPISDGAKNALCDLGIEILSKKSKVLNLKKLKKFWLIITMTQSIKNEINLPNCFSIFDFCGFEIFDPFGQSQEVYNQTAKQLEKAIDNIIEKLFKKGDVL